MTGVRSECRQVKSGCRLKARLRREGRTPGRPTRRSRAQLVMGVIAKGSRITVPKGLNMNNRGWSRLRAEPTESPHKNLVPCKGRTKQTKRSEKRFVRPLQQWWFFRQGLKFGSAHIWLNRQMSFRITATTRTMPGLPLSFNL